MKQAVEITLIADDRLALQKASILGNPITWAVWSRESAPVNVQIKDATVTKRQELLVLLTVNPCLSGQLDPVFGSSLHWELALWLVGLRYQWGSCRPDGCCDKNLEFLCKNDAMQCQNIRDIPGPAEERDDKQTCWRSEPLANHACSFPKTSHRTIYYLADQAGS